MIFRNLQQPSKTETGQGNFMSKQTYCAKCVEEGRKAFNEKEAHDNPYEYESNDWYSWRLGWSEAVEENEKKELCSYCDQAIEDCECDEECVECGLPESDCDCEE